MTKAEAILWKKISRKQLLGYKFRRQYSINNYVIDFYCPKLRLAIEIDGDLHFTTQKIKKYDRNRQIYLESLDISFLRFENHELYNNIDGVIRTIESYILNN